MLCTGITKSVRMFCGAHQADRVMVAGKWIVEDGQIPGLELEQLQAQNNRGAKRLQEM